MNRSISSENQFTEMLQTNAIEEDTGDLGKWS